MKVFIEEWYHPKNLAFLNFAFDKLNWEITNFEESEIVFSGSTYFPIECYPDKKFIFGPHFSVFPNTTTEMFENIHKNAIYIQPSQFVIDLWCDFGHTSLPMKTFAFGVDTERFSSKGIERNEIFIYYKQRLPSELEIVCNFLSRRNIKFKIFNYSAKYDEAEYLNTLRKSKYGIWLGRHESQGFALEEALSCDVPLLVWDVKKLSQEYGTNMYDGIQNKCTSIPYWDSRCGEYFFTKDELESTFNLFINKKYSPREYILENLSTDKKIEELQKLINF